MLRWGGLTQNVTVPVSAGLLTDTVAYFAYLTSYREGVMPSAIVERLAVAPFEATANGRQLVSHLRAIRADWDYAAKTRRGSAA